jgi:hypothetical protein
MTGFYDKTPVFDLIQKPGMLFRGVRAWALRRLSGPGTVDLLNTWLLIISHRQDKVIALCRDELVCLNSSIFLMMKHSGHLVQIFSNSEAYSGVLKETKHGT